MAKFLQKIFFGPPGCGKSFHVREVALELNIEKTLEALKASPNMIETAFHPEYGYGDFVAKLLPKTKEDGGIEYCIHAGPLIKALARAYANSDQSVLLVIDEINRGNCAQIFGDIFQLLDRNDEGYSEYGINPSDLIKGALKQELEELKKEVVERKQKIEKTAKKPFRFGVKTELEGLEKMFEHLSEKLKDVTGKDCKLRLSPNLSLIGTMNTSDESVYYMDTAFKRRWDFEYMPWDGVSKTPEPYNNDKIGLQKKAKIGETEHEWHDFLVHLNGFIAAKFKGRNVDDKQVGVWFLKAHNLTELDRYMTRLNEFQGELVKLSASFFTKDGKDAWKKCFPSVTDNTETELVDNVNYEPIKQHLKAEYKIEIDNEFFNGHGPSQLAAKLIILIKKLNVSTMIAHDAIKNKLMFFLWDNVFSRDHKSLHDLLKKGDPDAKEPRTFGAFAEDVDAFIKGVMIWGKETQIQ